jgi:hypothetical protein
MVLYYNIKKTIASPIDNQNTGEEEALKSMTEGVPKHIHPVSSVPTISQGIKDNYYNKIINIISGGSTEFYYSLLEDNFINLSIDDKLLIMHKSAIFRSSVTNNYILMCLALLVIIAFKLYSK